MVGDPVEPHLHAAIVGRIDKSAQIGHCSEITVHRMVVARCIGAAQRTDASRHTTRMDGHEPDDIDAQVLEIIKAGLCRSKRSLAREVIKVELIDNVLVRYKCAGACTNNLGQLPEDIVAVIGERAVNASRLTIPSENQPGGHRECARVGPLVDFVATLGITHIGHRRTRPGGSHIVAAVGITFPHPNLGGIGDRAVSFKEHTYFTVAGQGGLIDCSRRNQSDNHQ